MRAKLQSAGFTLVELIVATTLTVLVAGSTVVILRSTSAACQRADQQLELQQQARAGVLAVATALRNAARQIDKDTALEGIDGWLGQRGEEVAADRIRFFSVSHKIVRHGQPESDVKECEFFLSILPGRTWPALMRRIDPTRNERPDDGGVVELVAENVVELNLAYHDGIEWLDDWPKDRGGWPAAVCVKLTVLNEKNPSMLWTSSRVVNFPYNPMPRESQAE